ncbi:hypothetical protein PHYBLDRAFT_150050 [Phycomyces blakesleeanus NRRL 1555(-)]|uniref:Protein kinase domain-containing protein n=1 Tax=Phycomyces blakesleeanus (strain ATCC 8743b / DSM 1359 / FGSC 10004 / NBRC 33097 / NRRL 1555) TaxID=763407 RepID=A0A163D695_PHYB8|nr:hypothetical protein PHYBLDRAFT_150050 [Phycomyces blakesleeanus NRRL 1555(-)]OAD69050.1 hypothetical protein PHYBLDRAFT_150050 [Phycomyces blakesleeanus NRRL 1555(-)]|eukprot:XP_018287090.1 hypothetical protein PHYBLDRAFT_150050 [Phycomyces blakesleeanus NRRL 1555(-)]
MLRRQFYCITCSAIATYAVLTNMIPLGYAQTPTENYTPYNPSLGSVQITVPWRAAHASDYVDPYVILYGGVVDPNESSTGTLLGSSDVWAWDSRNGSWYNPIPTVQMQSGNDMLPQALIRAVSLPSSGQILAIVGNTTGTIYNGMLQKLDTNSWTWSFPTASLEPPARAAGFTLSIVNNTVYQYGGLGVGSDGHPMIGAVMNGLSLMDTSAYTWTTGSNGLGVTDHSTCYIPACNCLVVFGGTPTGSASDATSNLHTYDLNLKTWSLQVVAGSTDGAAPGARRLHTATCLDDKMVVFGGGTTQPYDSDVWYLDASSYPTLAWNRVTVANITQGPNARMGHTASLDKTSQKIYIYGGWGVSATNDSNMYVLDTKAWSWTRVAVAGYPVAIPPSISSSIPVSSATSDTTQPAATSSQTTTTATAATKSNNTPIIVGSVVGGLVFLGLIALLLFCCVRKRRQKASKESVPENMDGDGQLPKTDKFWTNNTKEKKLGSAELAYGNNPSDATLMTPFGNKRVSQAWTGTSSQRASLRPSELGDTDRVVTGVLEIMSTSPTIGDSPNHSNRGSRDYIGSIGGGYPSPLGPDSHRNSSLSALGSIPLVHAVRGPGQVPNEITPQKPNEFSFPTARFSAQSNTSSVPIDHLTQVSPSLISGDESGGGAPLSSSMEVLRSIKTNGSSMMSGGSRIVPVTHSYASTPWGLKNRDQNELEDDKWTLGDSLSVRGANAPPIRYIPPSGSGNQFSVATTATTSASTWNNKGSKGSVLLTHHQYPSSNMSVPLAQKVTPAQPQPLTINTVPSMNLQSFGQQQNDMMLYDSVSPLEMLATLGHIHDTRGIDGSTVPSSSGSSSDNNNNNSNRNNTADTTAATVATDISTTDIQLSPSSSGVAVVASRRNYNSPAATAASSERNSLTTTEDDSGLSFRQTNQDSTIPFSSSSLEATEDPNDSFGVMGPLISMLPRRYQMEKTSPPILGPANNVIFVQKKDTSSDFGDARPVVIKAFGRREAWERECRTLIKLKGKHAVELLEVLTIQNEPNSLQEQNSRLSKSRGKKEKQDDGSDDIKYVTVMERLDETLAATIRRFRNKNTSNTEWADGPAREIARDVAECLVWCHANDIAFCDLKPSNIMHNKHRPWKLIDFEASRMIGQECVGVITPRYCPPEVARATTYGLEGANGVVATASVDLWALGCVIYELATQRPLFASSIKDETILHFVSHPSPSTPILNNGLRWNEHNELEIPHLGRLVPNEDTRHLLWILLSRDPSKRGRASSLLKHPYFNTQRST